MVQRIFLLSSALITFTIQICTLNQAMSIAADSGEEIRPNPMENG
ncbi:MULTISPECIES: hypothetical protein [unclassified Sphingobacterium]|nr:MULTISPECIES: hypothetical protein [unclassified Sphingobacterium]